jgi:DMSO/TMAO reductase YedYZ heme-binding membrane subunit
MSEPIIVSAVENAPTVPASVPEFHPWRHAFMVSLVVWVVVLIYNFFYFHGDFTSMFGEALAAVGGILIGLSMVLSVITYFFDYFDHQLQYRKQYGLVGYFFALAYCFGLMVRFPERYAWGLPARLTQPEVLLGLGAMAILTFMAIISFPYFMRKMGVWWRPALRLGYLAYLLLILRAVIVEQVVWESWWANLPGLPPPRLLLTIFAMTVIIVRIQMEVMIRVKKLQKVSPSKPSSDQVWPPSDAPPSNV